MVAIRYSEAFDKEFWYRLDSHLPETEFENKVRTKMGYVIATDDKPIGRLRYNLFWDNTPFCTMLFIDEKYQGKGYGKKLLELTEVKLNMVQKLLRDATVKPTAEIIAAGLGATNSTYTKFIEELTKYSISLYSVYFLPQMGENKVSLVPIRVCRLTPKLPTYRFNQTSSKIR